MKLNIFDKTQYPVVPVYHSVANELKHPFVASHIHNVKPLDFSIQMEQFKKKYTVLSIDEIVERIIKGKSVKKTASITFDDGYQSVLENALPILNNLSLPATIFITGKVLEKSYFWRDLIRYLIITEQVEDFLAYAREKDPPLYSLSLATFYRHSKWPSIIESKTMEKYIVNFLGDSLDRIIPENLYVSKTTLNQVESNVLNIGNHSYSHYLMTSMNEQQQTKDITQGEKALKNIHLPKSRVFAIPFGGVHTYNSLTLKIVQKMNYAATLTTHHNKKFKDESDLFMIGRYLPASST